jgi:hypothetical protein
VNFNACCNTPSILNLHKIQSSCDWKWRSDAHVWNDNLTISIMNFHGSIVFLSSYIFSNIFIADSHDAVFSSLSFSFFSCSMFSYSSYRFIASLNHSIDVKSISVLNHFCSSDLVIFCNSSGKLFVVRIFNVFLSLSKIIVCVFSHSSLLKILISLKLGVIHCISAVSNIDLIIPDINYLLDINI